MNRSLLGRLVLRLLLVTVFFVVVSAGALVVQFLEQVETLRDRDLSGQARDVASHLVPDRNDGRVRLDLPDSLREEYAASDGMYLYVVLDGSGQEMFASPGADGPLAPVSDGIEDSGEAFQAKRLVNGQTALYYGITVPTEVAGRRFYVQVAQGPGHSDVLADEFLAELLDYVGWLAAGVVLTILAVVYVTVRSSLGPVTAISRQAREIGPNTLQARLGVRGMPRELTPLVDAVNNAFERIASAYRRQREFTDNAAHELRTPIAVLRANLESLDRKEVRDSLLPDVERLERLVEQLLRLARADNFSVQPDCRADLGAVAGDVAAMLAPRAVARRLVLELDAPEAPVAVRGDPDYLAIALRNIVENALNASPPGGTVTISVSPEPEITVTDEGRGIAPDLRERIFERFWRAGSEAEPGSGAGLGLSIVARIVEAHGGMCEVSDGPSGGCRFTMHLRPADAADGES